MKINYFDRETGLIKEEKIAGEFLLKWLYTHHLGENLLEKIIKKKIFSSFYGYLQDRPFSKRKINKFIQKYEIKMHDYQRQASEFHSFNDFFIRKLKEEARPIVPAGDRLSSPADGRLLAYQNIKKDNVVQIKGSLFALSDLLDNDDLAREYDGGSYIVIRLCPTDYHRFHFPDNGLAGETNLIEGDYYSVNPIALYRKAQLYCSNKRTITVFHSQNFDDILYLEVGATCVGSIVQTFTPGERVNKGQEKGYFKFGGSTIILVFKPKTIAIDADLLKNTEKDLETFVKMGSGLGKSLLIGQ